MFRGFWRIPPLTDAFASKGISSLTTQSLPNQAKAVFEKTTFLKVQILMYFSSTVLGRVIFDRGSSSRILERYPYEPPSPMADIKSLEYPTLKVPYEMLNKKFRTAQKNIDREVSHVTAVTAELEKSCSSGGRGSMGEIKQLLGSVVEKLNLLKRKADESLLEEVEAAQLCKRRLEHLKEGARAGGPADEGGSEAAKAQWVDKRVDRMLVEHFLRAGFYETALKLADRCGLRDLTNTELFLVSRDAEEALHRGDITACLAWCHDNKSKLRKLRSSLEFNLRQQEFIELVRQGQRLEAVKHARKHFSAPEPEQVEDIQKTMFLLALPMDNFESLPAPYRELCDPTRWRRLVEQFRFENHRLYQLGRASVFSVTLQAGLSAFKTPYCYGSDTSNTNCPVCSRHLNALAQPLPFAHCAQSRLICWMSGASLNENNAPLMLPNGHVYGEVALKQMASTNRGKVTCPRTGDVFDLKECEKVFVM
ncbi:macrophage erythroblast attacher isoform 1 [Tropilaelaps mercedesae]|uniref:E3 ubiquitin-protein transferase MAEA n=1 Tax=Tropilaelaps mercedesae TaxID=418985 RepID=A0A1V9XRW9_9ACAR|nr:macrophage erythroblast attacher isoform 1 [Tropilaelaps mercedesae]